MEPPLRSSAPALVKGGDAEFLQEVGGGRDIFGRDGVFQRLLGQAVATHQAAARRRRTGARPGSRRASSARACRGTGDGSGTTRRGCPAAPAAGSTRPDHQDRPRPGQVQHRLAQRPAHPVQHRGPGQEHPLLAGDPRQQFRLHVVAHKPVVAAEGDRGSGSELPSRRDSAARYSPAGQPSVRRCRSAMSSSPSAIARGAQQPAASSRVSARSAGPISAIRPSARSRATRSGGVARPGEHQAARRQARHRPAPTARPGTPGYAAGARHPGPAPPARSSTRTPSSSRGTTEPEHRTHRGGQRVEHPLADRLDRIQRLGDIAKQHLRVVVMLIDLTPRRTPGRWRSAHCASSVVFP